jgi:signal transduction histidine kinase
MLSSGHGRYTSPICHILHSTPGLSSHIREYRRSKDHGPGIPPEKKEGVFPPFFTAKKDGTGLGLPIVKKIVEAHKGRIEILV